eukprot:CAMPEP_0114143024 /NCGR_PEP_ID=MMETSP0043_2-20121206/18760_1 /TAXON_ID=464988 /ORGANISM="Hemiselmis andersenii, Strain CCMP644" /LENGTH=37 /DNA_ID= /DNA_START= /DNA_END= /DNA_ORIENTATION=
MRGSQRGGGSGSGSGGFTESQGLGPRRRSPTTTLKGD